MREQVRTARTAQWAAMAFVVAVVSALCLMAGAGTAFASPGNITTFKGTVHHSLISSGESVFYGYANGAKKVSDAKSSNTKVATVVASFKAGNQADRCRKLEPRQLGRPVVRFVCGRIPA